MITSYKFDLGQNMEDYTGELLWMHGTEDAVAPIETAEAACKSIKGHIIKKPFMKEQDTVCDGI